MGTASAQSVEVLPNSFPPAIGAGRPVQKALANFLQAGALRSVKAASALCFHRYPARRRCTPLRLISRVCAIVIARIPSYWACVGGGVYKGSVKANWVALLVLLRQCGNFVMQHLMEHGSPEQKALVLSALHADLKKAALHTHAVAVLDASLRFAALPDACELARQLLRVEQLLPRLATAQRGQRRGQDAVQRLLYVVDDQLLVSAALQLHDLRDSLRSSSGGRSILKVLSQRYSVSLSLSCVGTSPLR